MATLRMLNKSIFVFLFFSSGCASVPFNVNPLSSGPYTQNLNLVFVPLNYQDPKDFVKDRELLVQRLRRTAPFNEFPDKMKIWDLAIAEKQAQKVFLPNNTFPYTRVDQDFIKKVYDKIGANYKLILLDHAGTTDCSELSSPEATSVIILGRRHFNTEFYFSIAFLHELGHSLGLRDETSKSYARSCDPGYPNCAATKQEAEKWWGNWVGKDPQVGFFQGCCGREDHFKPTTVSLMNDIHHSSNFGPVNEAYLRRVLEGNSA